MIRKDINAGSKKSALLFALTGKGNIDGLTTYLLSVKNKDGTFRSYAPQVIRGNLDQVEKTVKFGKHKGQYYTGVLRFTEDNIPTEILHEIMAGHERMICAGVNPDDVPKAWILHKDKGSIELHFIYAKEHLPTGKFFKPYVHKIDKKRMNAWKIYVNAKYNLGDPDHPHHKRKFAETDIRLPADSSKVKEKLDEYVDNLIEAGVVYDRPTLLKALEKHEGVEISKITKNFVSVTVLNRKTPIRLKGSVYSESFTKESISPGFINKLAEEYDANRENREKEAGKLAEELYNKKVRMLKAERNYEPDEKEILKGKIYEMVDDLVFSGKVKNRDEIANEISKLDKVKSVETKFKHYLSVTMVNSKRPFRLNGEVFERDTKLDEYVKSIVDSKKESDKQLEEQRRKAEEYYYFKEEFSQLDFVRMKDTRWYDFAKRIDSKQTLEKHFNDKYGIINYGEIKTQVEANNEMTEFDLSIFRVYANDLNFTFKDNNKMEINNDSTSTESSRVRTDRILQTIMERSEGTRRFTYSEIRRKDRERRSIIEVVKSNFIKAFGIRRDSDNINEQSKRDRKRIDIIKQISEELKFETEKLERESGQTDERFTRSLKILEDYVTKTKQEIDVNKKQNKKKRNKGFELD
jgi:hypothetical protein